MSSAGRKNDGWVDVASPDDGWVDVVAPKPVARAEESSGGLINSYTRQDTALRDEDEYNSRWVSDLAANILELGKGTAKGVGTFIGSAMKGVAASEDMSLAADRNEMSSEFGGPSRLTEELRRGPAPRGPVAEDPLYKAGTTVQEKADIFPAAKGREDSVGRMLGEGLGTLGGGVLTSLIGGPAMAGTAFAYSGSGEAVDRAIKAGATEDQILAAAKGGIIPGLTDSAPIEVLLGRIPGPTGMLAKMLPTGEIGTAIKAAGKIGWQALIEGVQEGGQEFLQNVIAKDVYKPDQKLGENVVPSGAGGAGVGTIAEVGKMALEGFAGRRGARMNGLLNGTEDPGQPSRVNDYIETRNQQLKNEPIAVLPPQPEAKVAVAEVLDAPDIDTAIDAATRAAAITPESGGANLTEAIAAGKDMLDKAAPNPQLEKLGKLFQGLNEGEVEKVDELTYNYKPRGEEQPIPLRVWDPGTAPKTDTTISPEIAQAQRDYYTGEHGIDVVYFENDDRIPFDGVVDPTQPNTLFLSNDPSRNALQVGAHEFTHLLEEVKGPDGESLADILHQQIFGGITDLGWDYAKTRFSGTAPDRALFGEEGPEGDAAHAQAVTAHFIKELAGDIGGEAPKFDTFIPKVMAEVENRYGKSVAAEMFQKFMDGIRSAMETIKAFFVDGSNTVSQHLVTNLDQVHTTLAKMYAAKYGEALEDPLTSPELSKPFERVGPAPRPGYEEAKVRATNLKRWIDELDTKRREDAKTDPEVVLLQAQEHDILRKVGGVEERLTKAASQRLAFVREKIEARLNPKGDNYDMARVREAMVAEHEKMAKYTAVSKKAAFSPKQQETPEFKKWFGGSKITDDKGKPLVVYHGTKADFSSFKPGSMFTADRAYAENYGRSERGGRVEEVYLKIENPLDMNIDADRSKYLAGRKEGETAAEYAERSGYDGLVTSLNEIIAFKPEQIKSAVGNRGTFDKKDPRIAFSPKTPAEEKKAAGVRYEVDADKREVRAYGPRGNEVGYLSLEKYDEAAKNNEAFNMAVKPGYQRLGLMKALHEEAEKQFGKINPSGTLSDDGFAFWKSFRPEAVSDRYRFYADKIIGRTAPTYYGEGVIESVSDKSMIARLPKGTTALVTKEAAEKIFQEVSGGKSGAKFSPKTALKLKEPPNKTKEMLDTVPGLKRVFANLTPEEHGAITSRTADKLVKLFSDLPSGEETAAVAFSGRAKRGWYRQSANALVEVFGQDDAPRFVALLAALSPQTSVESNLENALSTWVNWVKEGRPTDHKKIGQILGRSVQGSGNESSVLDAWRGNAIRSLVHQDPGHIEFALSGAKVNSFGQNLRNYVNEVTNDAWMATFAGLEGEALASARKPNKIDDIGKSFGFKSPGYLALSAMVRDAAKTLTRKTGQTWTPAEIQETVWSWAKTLYERRDRAGEDRTAQQILKAADMTHEDVNSTPDFAKLLVTGIYRNILERGDYGKAIEKLESTADGGGRITGPAVSVTSAEGSGFAQSAFEKHLQRAAARLERIRTDRLTAKGVNPRDMVRDARDAEIRANLSAATNSIPGIRQLVEAADAGDESAGRLVNLIAHESLERLVSSIPGAKLEVTLNGGLYGGALEPSLGVKVVFEEQARGTVLAALAKFADNFNQQQIHVRQETIDPAGRVYTDGSYATDVYVFDLAQPLSRAEIEQVIADSGLYGLNFNDRQMEAYYVGDPRDKDARAEFHAAIERARESLGGRAEGLEHAVERLWPYGEGEGAVAGYAAIGGELPASTAKHTEVPRALAERQLGYAIEPSTAASEVTPEQAQLQRRIADHYDQLPDNDLANPNVAKAYTELTKELGKQFESLPVKVDVWDPAKGEPYKSSADMRRDILDNNHMWIFATSPESFGPPGADFTGHPLLEPTGKKSNNGHPMLVNDELRAVHDYFAHMMTASDFGPKGEEAAWRNHIATIDNPWARWALTSETRGQNSWVNFGAHVEPGSSLRDRPFARQKAALLPITDALTGSDNLDLPIYEFMRTLPLDQQNGSLPQGADDPFADFSPRVTPQMREELIRKNPDFLSIFRRPGEKVPDKEPVPAAPKKKAQGRQPLPMNKDRVFKTNALKIADEHADEVTAIETKAMQDVAAKTNSGVQPPAPVEPSKVEPAPVVVELDYIEPPARRKSLQPIDGTGRERERAINNDIYNVGEEQPQMDRAAALVERDRAKAIRIAMRQEPPPAGVHPEFVYMAVDEMARRENDYALQEKLSRSIIAEEATTMGQRIAAWRNRAEISPTDDMRRIREAREARLAKTEGQKPEDLVNDALKASRKAAKSTKGPTLNEMIQNLICKT